MLLIRSNVPQLQCCGLDIRTRSGPPHIGETPRDGRCVRSWVLGDDNGDYVFHMFFFLCGWVVHMMDYTAEALDKGR